MKFSIELLPNEPITNIIDLIKLSENIGFENVWITDHYNNKNVFEVLAVAALETSTINMGSGVSNPYVRNPVTLASATTTLDELTNGRALIGVGPGDKATMDTLNLKWEKPVQTVKDAVTTIRTLITGGKTESGAYLSGTRNVQESIPIYIGAQGPKMLELSGEVADGVLINASNYKDFEIDIPLVEKGLKNSGKSSKDFNMAAYTACCIDMDQNKAHNQTRIVVAFIIAGAPQVVLERHNISFESAQKIKDALSKNDFKTASSLVTDDMIHAFSVCGTPSQIQEEIEILEKIGVNEFVVGSPIGKNRIESLKLLEDVINSFN